MPHNYDIQHDLPKTFQGAIVFCQELGIGHIWIDSLCFLQDDDNDWAAESAMMASVYSGAVFTIAATAFKDRSEGCFRTDDRKPLEFFSHRPEIWSNKSFCNAWKPRKTDSTHSPSPNLKQRARYETEAGFCKKSFNRDASYISKNMKSRGNAEELRDANVVLRILCNSRGATLITRGRQSSAITPDARSRIAETNCRRYPE
jgi:hypothetical protein